MNLKEIAAYLKIKGPVDPETEARIKATYPVAERAPLVKSIVRVNILPDTDGVLITDAGIFLPGKLAATHFADCRALYIILASLGMESERMIKERYALSPTEGLILDACYSELLERRLDGIEEDLARDGDKLTSRISCGYGDLPIGTQRPLLELLNARSLGVFINDACMLVPNKSVVALVGVSERK